MGLSFQNARVPSMFPKERVHNLECRMYSWDLAFSCHCLPFRLSLAGNILSQHEAQFRVSRTLSWDTYHPWKTYWTRAERTCLPKDESRNPLCFTDNFCHFICWYTYRIQRCRCCWDYYCGRLSLPQCYIVMNFEELTEDTLINLANTCKPIDDRFYHCWIPR